MIGHFYKNVDQAGARVKLAETLVFPVRSSSTEERDALEDDVVIFLEHERQVLLRADRGTAASDVNVHDPRSAQLWRWRKDSTKQRCWTGWWRRGTGADVEVLRFHTIDDRTGGVW